MQKQIQITIKLSSKEFEMVQKYWRGHPRTKLKANVFREIRHTISQVRKGFQSAPQNIQTHGKSFQVVTRLNLEKIEDQKFLAAWQDPFFFAQFKEIVRRQVMKFVNEQARKNENLDVAVHDQPHMPQPESAPRPVAKQQPEIQKASPPAPVPQEKKPTPSNGSSDIKPKPSGASRCSMERQIIKPPVIVKEGRPLTEEEQRGHDRIMGKLDRANKEGKTPDKTEQKVHTTLQESLNMSLAGGRSK